LGKATEMSIDLIGGQFDQHGLLLNVKYSVCWAIRIYRLLTGHIKATDKPTGGKTEMFIFENHIEK
jgi:hypothetical protein